MYFYSTINNKGRLNEPQEEEDDNDNDNDQYE